MGSWKNEELLVAGETSTTGSVAMRNQQAPGLSKSGSENETICSRQRLILFFEITGGHGRTLIAPPAAAKPRRGWRSASLARSRSHNPLVNGGEAGPLHFSIEHDVPPIASADGSDGRAGRL